jgi:type 2 lantibiotic biosynthesis protein LanM
MDQPCFDFPTWYRALTLTERVASLRSIQFTTPQIEKDADLAERRMQRWRAQRPFSNRSYLAQRLAIDGLSEDEFLHLLSEPIEAVRGRFSDPPGWLADLGQAFSRPAFSDSLLLPEIWRVQDVAALLDLIGPLVRQGRDRLHDGIRALVQKGCDPPFSLGAIEEMLVANLPPQLIQMLTDTIVLELNVARLQGLLEGDTPEARFQSFCHRLRQRDVALAILREYPVLARQLVIRIDQWVQFCLEFVQHLCVDWKAIRSTFICQKDDVELVHVHRAMSPSHPGIRGVLIAKFSSGAQVVYKPWPVAVDVHFQELLTWLNNRRDHAPFRTLAVLDRDTYGWIEFIAPENCASDAQVRSFYERQGGYLALLYTLEAIDFRFQNVIAAGEQPILIDLDTLFHVRAKGIELYDPGQPALNTMTHSVLRVGLLPQRSGSNAESEGADFSGLGGPAGQLTPERVPYWEAVGTDEMRLAYKRTVMPGGQNRPTLKDTDIDVLNYADAITAGFTTMYQLLLKYRQQLLADNGPLARFADDEVRVIVRPGLTYGLLLHSYHPDVLRDALDRDRFFDWLWVEVERRPYLAQVIPAEREDLQNGDMPIFRTRPASRDLWTSTNRQIPDFFDESGMTLVKRRIQQLSNEDLTRQLWFIRASLATLTSGQDRARWPSHAYTEPQIIATSERLLGASRAVGDRLEAQALRGREGTSWIGLANTHERLWSIAPSGMDLYDGLPGIALFLAYLGAITEEERYSALAQCTITTLRHQVERGRSFITSIGGFTGWGGLIYTLIHLGTLWDEQSLLAEAEAMVEGLPPLIENDKELDFIGGAAGCIGSLLALHHCAPSDRTLDAAVQCGDRLIDCAQGMSHGIGWTTVGETKPLAGFSRGAAGIAWALLELAALTGKERFRTAALDAIAYERSLFSHEAKNWPDLRELNTANPVVDNGQSHFMTTWCHGAAGIGLARLRSLAHLDDEQIRAEIDTTLKTTLTQGFGGNHSLCHGDLGNLELLLQASQVLGPPHWYAQANRVAAMILESINQHGWLCGTPLGVESPGLMTGLAGIGYGLLRMAEPARVPSVLMLEPPRR